MQKIMIYVNSSSEISEASECFPECFRSALEFCVDVSAKIERGKFSLRQNFCVLYFSRSLSIIGSDGSAISFDEEETIKSIALGKGRDPLLKAFGRMEVHEKIIDATAGTLKDSLHLVKLGFKVIAFERHPVIYAFLNSGLQKYRSSIELIFGDFSKLSLYESHNLQNGAYSFSDSSIYFDPMYEGTLEKSAKPRKEMLIFHELFEQFPFHDDKYSSDQETFFKLENICQKKLVVKRSPKAKSFKQPTYTIESKSVRFDVYDLSFKNKGKKE